VYDPTKNSEILEAERASDEKRDIMSRMIGAEIRYTRLGYWARRAPLGYVNIRAETMHGKRALLEPHPIESQWILKMFELRCRGSMNDKQIVKEVNKLGYKSRINIVRSSYDRTRLVGKSGGGKLTVKAMQKFVRNPVYAGINDELWLLGNPVRCRFKGLVTVDDFNKANRGKVTITEKDGVVAVLKAKIARNDVKGRKTHEYPYRRVVLCPGCGLPLFGSASRGKGGKHYPAYHCNTSARPPKHNFRVPREKLHDTIEEFVQTIQIAPRFVGPLVDAVIGEWNKRQYTVKRDVGIRKLQINELKTQARMVAERIKFCSPTTIKYLEEDLIRIEQQIAEFTPDRTESEKITVDEHLIKKYAKYFAKYPEYLLLEQQDPVQKANYFGLLFEQLPTYQQLERLSASHQNTTKLSEVFERYEPI
jgi:site-specific DNA recombinase